MKTQFDRNKLRCRMYHDDTLKWEHDGKHYLLHVQADEMAESPREWDNITTMACWHSRYSLGDEKATKNKSPEEFWRGLVGQYVSDAEIFQAALNGKLSGIRIQQCNEHDSSVDIWDVYETFDGDFAAWKADIYKHYNIYETSYLAGWQTSREAQEYLEYEFVYEEQVADYLYDDLTISNCQTLLEPYLEYLNLYLYDHSGITMSCGTANPFACRWDSGQVGWIIAFKDVVMKETREYVLDENGERIRIEYQHPNGQVTYSYKTQPLTDDTWRKRAIEIMEGDVETYDTYLTGEVYGYQLYEYEPSEDDDDEIDESSMNEIDACWGFYGDDIVESGLVDNVGCGLLEAIAADTYEEGEATLHHSHYYTY